MMGGERNGEGRGAEDVKKKKRRAGAALGRKKSGMDHNLFSVKKKEAKATQTEKEP